ncbi:hypothetical protein [uncultured Kordia sp.]|uniref:hypothetical protein n=1 Tax=uncultured Kordia sp. TaxID=507699 RepID=UPI002632CF46|nr:hypothetical protein [uncultured Kordia sp.]
MEKALTQFVNLWKDRDEIVGILLTGSFAVNAANQHSDVDIKLIVSPTQKKSIKGLCEIDGFSFSYIGRTEEAIKRKFNSDFFSTSKLEAKSIHIGRILYQKNNELTSLKEIASYYYSQPFLKKNIADEELKSMMYSLYSRYTYLNKTDIDSPFFVLNYVMFMKLSLDYYAAILNVELFPFDTKIENILTNKEYLEKYNLAPFPDATFIKLWIHSLHKENINKENLDIVYGYMKDKIYPLNPKNFDLSWIE